MSTTVVTAGETFEGNLQPAIAAGDSLVVEAGGTSYETSIAGGTEIVDGPIGSVTPSGYALATSVGEGGILEVDGGEAANAVAEQGGTLVDNGGLDLYSFINSSVGIIENNAVSFAPTVDTAGTLTVSNATVYSPTIAGGTLDLTDPRAVVNGTISFADFDNTTSTVAGGVLELSAGHDIGNTISGFAPGDAIAVAGLSGPATLVVAGDTAVIAGPSLGDLYSLTITGASTDDLTLNVVGGTDEIVWGLPQIVCFLAGTGIATADGTRAIETLAAGDLVLTADGLSRPVRWLGRQTAATRFADPARIAPIRIRAGALGEHLPVRDLLVSPDHALLVDGVLVQAGALVNGASITREDRDLPEVFTYYHVELAEHALILAEGVPAETFIDNVDRLAFDNWHEHEAAPDAAPLVEMAHPRAKSHRQVPLALRARLLQRGVELYGEPKAAAA